MESSPEAALNLLPGYDRVAVEYTRRFCDEMDTKAFDRKGLDWPVEKATDVDPILKLVCGPGQITSSMHYQGVESCGIDLSGAKVRQVQKVKPHIMGKILTRTDACGSLSAYFIS